MTENFEREILASQGLVRMWLVEAGMMGRLSTAIALQLLELEIRRNIAIVGDGTPSPAVQALDDVISSTGLNLVDIGPMKQQD
ncbi:MAG: hypothetical protein KME13_20380 [Myxacorys californica WJT36-NPBG1]|jgi:hypothetical protein|nr:hypothetical protein [Myxacorys californica WJT36-NPBG1]